MAKRMLIDASHPEETRVVVLSGTRLEEFDFESAARTQLKGNIYLAKVTRVEPSLQAAFVEYGGNRHGFLPFSEIHPDYYRIPIADREALIAEEARLGRETAAEDTEPGLDEENEAAENAAEQVAAEAEADEPEAVADGGDTGRANGDAPDKVQEVEVEDRVDTVGGDEVDDNARKRARLLRHYKIQEVIKRRQVMLVQVSKEERGNKGAALTTYLSLAGRYCVLMPNTGRGGGISRKIGSVADRRRLKQVVSELDIPDGMAVIVRTAGSERSKVEVRRDYEYLMRLWSEIRETTLKSSAPALIYEEANLIKRAIRDLYSRDMEDILVEGEEGHKAAKAFMKSLTPSHARKVQLYKDDTVPLYYRYKVESQLDAMHSSSVQLRSGGYIVMNPTEALVAIDVNSGRATRERHIEETALKTNIEAAEEVARQLRLRDLAGLIVIDFIDMEESRHNREVERRFKEAMRHDRARIQFGRISPFGLLEMSRQRLRPSLFESSTVPCSRCGGSGHVRSIHSSALHVLRAIEEEGMRRGGGRLALALPTAVAFYILNEKRNRLGDIEARYELEIRIDRNDNLVAPDFTLQRLSSSGKPGLGELPEPGEAADSEEDGRKRRGRRRRRRKDGTGEEPAEAAAAEAAETGEEAEIAAKEPAAGGEDARDSDEQRKPRRRRGKRGGKRRAKRRREEEIGAGVDAGVDAAPEEAEDRVSAPTAEELETVGAVAAQAETAEPAEEPSEAKAAKPARRTRRRNSKPATTEPEAESPPVEADAPAMVPAEEAEAETKPKAPKRRRAKAAADGAAKKTAPRRRKKAPEAEEAAGAADRPAAPRAAPAEGDSRKAQEVPAEVATAQVDPAVTPAATRAVTPAGPPGREGSGEAPALDRAAASADSEAENQAKRRGWWQRWV
ncbi:MAG: Rne/Rng family ribonuclease [Rhodospirillales bacterium]|nr:Rne/Rng family ribonuclease [Rhodospirillales bacterium]